MRKKRVVSVFTVLLLLGIGLAIFSFLHFGSITGRVIDDSYNHELFSGAQYEFEFYPSKFDVQNNVLYVEGNLVEVAGKDHNLQAIGYAFDGSGENSGTLATELYLGAEQSLNVKLAMDVQSNAVRQALLYFEDEHSSIRIEKEFESPKSMITGSAIQDGEQVRKGTFTRFFFGVLLLLGGVLFVVSRLKQHNQQSNLDNLFVKKESRKYIDLDVR